MLHTLIVGMGRAGRRLHLPSLAKVRTAAPGLLAPSPIVAFDPFRPPAGADGVVTVGSLEEAARCHPPARTVVHLCTPPHVRAAMLDRLAGLGHRKIIVEKPLAVDLVGLAAVARIRRRWNLDLAVATHWLDSALTRRLRAAVTGGRYGRLRRIHVVQNKPRFALGTGARTHPTAFDVEMPHALAVVLDLAGDARITGASWDDLVIGGRTVPRLGGAHLRLSHRSGVRTEIDSDLTSPVRERRITLEFDEGVLVGHYPCSDADHTAQLRTVRPRGGATWTVFDDDAFPAFLGEAYGRFAAHAPTPTLPLQVEAVRLLTEAKRHCAGVPEVRGV
ncbi:oxidoreductase [Actinomadura sp. WMMB 499]|uniref:oxidoreductase n=1 Tax=Actinomadura sp. WMMB 499 TaxID=1219491 RepID=UPI0012446826|nr:oxidoreductase [Actinomadura sp. WMMB 499]QFG22609.1 oxidoreductase [Actinomadura sp. WMMB 499]